MRYEIGLAAGIIVTIMSLYIVYIGVGLLASFVIIGVLALEMRIFTIRRVGMSWGNAFFLCFILNPAIVAIEILIFFKLE